MQNISFEHIAIFIGFIADAISIILAFKSDKNNGLTLTNYSNYIYTRKEEYKSEYVRNDSSSDTEEILKYVLLIGLFLFAVSVGLYLYLFLTSYIFVVFSLLLLIAILRLRKLNYPVLSFTVQRIIFIVILSKRYFTTDVTKQFFNNFSSLNLNTAIPSELGSNIRIIWNALWSRLSSGVFSELLTAIIAIVIVIIFWVIIAKLIKIIFFPKRFNPLTGRMFAVFLMMLILILNLNNLYLIEFVSKLWDKFSNFIKEFSQGFLKE